MNGPGLHVLYRGYVTGIAMAGDHVVIAGDGAILSVPLSGGTPTTLANASNPFGVAVAGNQAYFIADGGQLTALYAVPVSGGSTHVVLDNQWSSVLFGDAQAVYLSTNDFTILRVDAASGDATKLALDGSPLVYSIATQGSSVYVAGMDALSQAGTIQRGSVQGGSATPVVSGIGQPDEMTADASGLYWDEGPLHGFAAPNLRHSNLDGSLATTLLSGVRTLSLVASGGTLYFSTGDHIASLAQGSDQPKTIVSGLRSAGMLQVAGENLVWVDPVNKAMSDPTVPVVETACVH